MRIAAKNLTRIGAVGLLVLVVGVAGCSSTKSERTMTGKWHDKATVRNVEKELAKDPLFKYPNVDVTAYQGNVQLTGFVSTEEQRLQAAQSAARVPGVNQVVNQIMIKPSTTGRATIRDPLGHETGRVMLYTNAPPQEPLKMNPLPSGQEQQQGTQQ